MFLLYYVDDCLMFSLSKNKIGEVYVSLQEYFKTEDDGYLNKYLGIDLDLRPDGSIHLSQPYLTNIILNMIPGMENSSAKPTPAVKPPQREMKELKQEKMNLITDQ